MSKIVGVSSDSRLPDNRLRTCMLEDELVPLLGIRESSIANLRSPQVQSSEDIGELIENEVAKAMPRQQMLNAPKHLRTVARIGQLGYDTPARESLSRAKKNATRNTSR